MRTIGPYQLVEELGHGSSGIVWRARNPDRDRDVALKVLYEHLARDEMTSRRFLSSARRLKDVPIAGAVPVLDVVAADGHSAIAMELIEAPSLRELIKSGPLLPGEAVAIAAQVAETLAEAHGEGVIHRDVKPENILVLPADGDVAPRALVADFGIASMLDATTTLTTTQPGTPAYTAPEAFANEPPAPARDLYAVGIVLYEMLTGHRPFRSTSPAGLMGEHRDVHPQRPDGMPDELWSLVERCLAKEPDRRPTAAHLARGLSVLLPRLSGTPRLTLSGPEALTEPRLRVSDRSGKDVNATRSRNRLIGAVAAAAVLVGAGGLAASYAFGEDTSQQLTLPSLPVAPAPTESVETDPPGPTTTITPPPPPVEAAPPTAAPQPTALAPRPDASRPSSAPPARTQAAQPTCPGAACNGAMPSTFNRVCYQGAQTSTPVPVLGGKKETLATLSITYSPRCGTAWATATVISPPQGRAIDLRLHTPAANWEKPPQVVTNFYTTVMRPLSPGECARANMAVWFLNHSGKLPGVYTQLCAS